MTSFKRIGSALLATALAASVAASAVPIGAQTDPTGNLVLHYDFESLKSGTIINDVSGHGKAGVVRPEGSGVTTKDVNIYGTEHTAFVMDGGQPDSTHTYAEMPNGVLNGLEDVTISCWVNIENHSGYNRIWDIGSDTTSYLYLISDGYNAGHMGYTAALTNGGWSNEKGPQKGENLATGVWKLTTVTFDGSSKTMKLYEDGKQIGDAIKTDADLSVLQDSTQNWIGYGQFKNNILDGMVADFKIYDYAMSDSQVAEQFDIPDEQRVALDKQQLDLGDLSAVTNNLTLPAAGSAGSVISWSSSDTDVIANDGTVTRPAAGQSNAEVTLTATLTAGTISDTKNFTATVVALPTNQQIVDSDLAAINLGNLSAVTGNLTLPNTGALGSSISWESSHPDIIAADGTVSRPVGAAAQVTLTATATSNGTSANRSFEATVLPVMETLDIVKVQQVNVTTAAGMLPSLPATVQVTYEDDSNGFVKAVWPTNLTTADFAEPGSKQITGTLVGSPMPVIANVTITAETPAAPEAAASAFALSDISLDGNDTIYSQNMNRTLEYLKIMDADQMLYNFRATFGQDTKGVQPLTGWDEPTGLLRGHSTGHFLSALAQAYATTGDQAYKQKLDYMIAEMRKLQELSKGEPENFKTACSPSNAAQELWSKDPNVWGEGYIGAYSPDQFALLEQYTPYATIWAPYYTMHKLLAGFIDSYTYSGNETALEIAKELGSWVYQRLSSLTPEQRSKMWSMYIAGEYGGMNEALARLYEITRDSQYIEAAKMFDNTAFFNGLANNVDTIQGRHANQHIPQIVGAVHEYAATGDKTYYNIAKNFWDMTVSRYAYSIGGVGTGERFKDPYKQAANILGNSGRGENCETCAAYNMLKLTKDLYNYDPDNAEYMDYYERTLINQIAASQSHETNEWMHNGVTYMLPIDPGQRRGYDSDYGGFTCCNGTGMENHVKYQAAAYAKAADTLYVNLYMPTTVDWAEKGVSVQQQTQFPSEHSTLTVNGSGSFTMKLRVPYWATAGFTVKVNGETVCTNPETSSYVAINRSWKDGDKVEIDMPYTLHLDKTPDTLDGAEVASVMYGPMVMVAKDTRSQYTPMNWYTLALDADLSKSIQIVTGTDADTVPHLTTNGLNFYPMYDAYNYRYHAYVKLQPTSSIVNKENLQALIDSAESLHQADYTADSWTALETALTAAKSVLGNPDATQVDVYNAQTALSDALNGLVNSTKVNKDTLNLFIAKAQSFVDDGTVNGLVASAKKVYLATLAKAKEVAGNENATYAEVVDIQTKLLVCIHSVSLQAGDKQALGMLLASCDNLTDEMLSANYVEAGQAEYKAALAAAKAVYADGDAFQEDVDKAHSDLSAAVLALRMKADKSALQALLNQVGGINLSLYTEASAAVFTAALANANSVLANEALSVDEQAAVDEAVKTLQAAADGLELKSASTDDTSSAGSNNSGSSSKPDSGKPSGTTSKPSAQTGDAAPIAAALLLATAAAGMMIDRRKKK